MGPDVDLPHFCSIPSLPCMESRGKGMQEGITMESMDDESACPMHFTLGKPTGHLGSTYIMDRVLLRDR